MVEKVCELHTEGLLGFLRQPLPLTPEQNARGAAGRNIALEVILVDLFCNDPMWCQAWTNQAGGIERNGSNGTRPIIARC